MVGTIARVMFEKGFGFIRDETGREYFFHRSALAQWDAFDRLQVGARVMFETEPSEKGPRAGRVEVL